MSRPFIYKALAALGTLEANALEKASHCPRQVQLAKLKKILSRNGKTSFGRQHNFASIKSLADYQAALPIRTYEDFRPYIEQVLAGQKGILTEEETVMFATTSGTTGKPKFAPVTKSYIEEYRRASIVSYFHLLKQFPHLAHGTALPIVSSACEGLSAGGIPYGAISGLLFKQEPPLIKKYVSPIPYEVFLIEDYDTRYYTLCLLALSLPTSIIYTPNPSTIILLAKKLQAFAPHLVKDVFDGTINPPGKLASTTYEAIKHLLAPDAPRSRQLAALLNSNQFTPAQVWPNLQTIACWTKAAASFYLKDFSPLFGNLPVCDINYGASEGRGTAMVSLNEQMLALRSHFYEFIAEEDMESKNPQVLIADQVEPGKKYFILFTTSGGLYRYNINDVVKVVGFHNKAPLLEFQYKGGNISSFTGEKLTELQVTEAMSMVVSDTALDVNYFTVIPKYGSPPHYELWLETRDNSNGHQFGESLAYAFDRTLSKVNIEYASKRESQRLNPVVVRFLNPGTYYQLRRTMTESGTADAQIKLSHLNPKKEIMQDLEQQLLVSKA
jgi:hypothetical protein